jgi:hypothetical protein
MLVVASTGLAATPSPTVTVTPTPIPEPTPAFGRVVYRAARAASFESLGVTMIACRHRDAEPRRFVLQFFDPLGRPISMANRSVATIPPGKKILWVTDLMHFERRPDVTSLGIAHLSRGTARVVSDATIVHCVGKIRFDAGARMPSWRDEIGLTREGLPLPTMSPYWLTDPHAPRRRAVAP